MMPRVFADTSFWVGRNFPNDQWHRAALEAERRLGRPACLFTTQEVLTEFLAFVSEDAAMRREGVELVDDILRDPNITVFAQTAETFAQGFELYRNRMDKGYSLVDCISMVTMDDHGIAQVLTSDHHFEQEGRFVALMRR